MSAVHRLCSTRHPFELCYTQLSGVPAYGPTNKSVFLSVPHSIWAPTQWRYWSSNSPVCCRDCGLACALMVLKSLGVSYLNMASLRSLCSTTRSVSLGKCHPWSQKTTQAEIVAETHWHPSLLSKKVWTRHTQDSVVLFLGCSSERFQNLRSWHIAACFMRGRHTGVLWYCTGNIMRWLTSDQRSLIWVLIG